MWRKCLCKVVTIAWSVVRDPANPKICVNSRHWKSRKEAPAQDHDLLAQHRSIMNAQISLMRSGIGTTLLSPMPTGFNLPQAQVRTFSVE
jgi:hypothetical protein